LNVMDHMRVFLSEKAGIPEHYLLWEKG